MSQTIAASLPPKLQQHGDPYPWYSPRIWHGMRAGDWWRLLRRHYRDVSLPGWGMVLTTTMTTPINTVLSAASELVYRRRAEQTQVLPPLFVVGHWRSGTTMLHELLTLDERFGYPTTYQCLGPHHFLLSESWLAPVMQFFSPRRRPMDAMPLHVSLPQEDEFALCNLAAPSPYVAWAFPDALPDWPKLLDTEGFSPADRRRWQDTFLWFARRLTYHTPKRLIFKSPPHTARIKALLEIFPDAQFVHILRDPYVVFPSTVRTWKRLCESQWFQISKLEGTEEQVLEAFVRLYRAYERDRPLVPPGRLCEVRFEDLVARPLETLEGIYQQLGMEGYDAVRPKFEQYFAERKDYKKNEYRLDPDLERRVTERWGEFIERWGYGRGEEPASL
jgi:hypothetical protein